jgi:IS6 family transposase
LSVGEVGDEAVHSLLNASEDGEAGRYVVQLETVVRSEQRDTGAARRFFTHALVHGRTPVGVTTDKAAPYLRVLDELDPAAAHFTEQYSNNRI